MHRRSLVTVLAAAMVTSGALGLTSQAIAADSGQTFTASLSGDAEVPPEEGAPPVETMATGDATFEVSADGTEVSYTLNVSGLENVLMGHIHVGGPDENGPVVVWLYPEGGPPPELIEGTTDGELASGTFTADDLMEDLEGGTIDDLVAEMAAGNTYVNVHTEQYEAGEIRGQISEGGGAIEQPDRVDTGAGGTAGSSGPVALVAVAGLTAVAIAAVIVVRRRVTS